MLQMGKRKYEWMSESFKFIELYLTTHIPVFKTNVCRTILNYLFVYASGPQLSPTGPKIGYQQNLFLLGFNM
jgi:hypothetical protein